MVESSIWWFGHVSMRPLKVRVRRVNQMNISLISRGRGNRRKVKGVSVIKLRLFNNSIMTSSQRVTSWTNGSMTRLVD
ncbi:hypothetical protein Lal_00001133 [Lupinus albus]|nr:hypothetical protein Lal_00001133 [Lupinus albus]